MKDKVLVCEDNKLTQRVIEVALRRLNYDIMVAQDGEEGIKMIKENDIKIIITDINMPYNSGLELVQYVRKHYKVRIPIIIVTNINLEETRKHAFELGADRFITKPFDPEELITAIKSLQIAN